MSVESKPDSSPSNPIVVLDYSGEKAVEGEQPEVEPNLVAVLLYPDPLQSVPSARADFSMLGATRRGADEANRITAAAKSIFNRRGLVQAMDAIYVQTHPEAAEAEGHLKAAYPKGFDFDLANSGLSWLRKNLTDISNPALRPDVLSTKAVLPGRQRLTLYQEQAARTSAPTASAGQAPSAIDQTAETVRAQKAARQAQYRHQFSETVNELRERDPHLDFQSFIELGEWLNLDDEPTGLVVREGKGFRARFDKQVATYLDDPGTLVNDLGVLMLAGATAEHSSNDGPDAANDGTSIYAKKIFDEISSSLLRRRYDVKDLSPEIAAKWLSLTANLSATMSADAAEEVRHYINDDGESNFTTTGLAMLYGRRILLNSLRDIVSHHPKHFIGKAHMIASAGLEAMDAPMLELTVGLLERCLLDQDRAGHTLVLSLAAKNQTIQRQAIDLEWYLYNLGIPETTLAGQDAPPPSKPYKMLPGNVPELSFILARELYSTAYVRSHNGMQTYSKDAGQESIDHGKEEFWAYVRTPAGAKNTLSGRFLSLKQAGETATAEALAAIKAGRKRSRLLGPLGRLIPKRP